MRTRAGISIALLALVGAVVVFDGGLLWGGLPRGEDHWLAFIPAYAVGERGLPPRWNPHVLGGVPHAANPQFCAWYPPAWIFRIANVLDAYGPYCFAHFLMAALALFACLRVAGCEPPGAAIGALAFVGGSYIQGHLSNPGLLFSSVWLPLVLACSLLAFERKGLFWPALLGTSLALVVFAGSPHNMIYAGLIVGLVAGWVAVFGEGTGRMPVLPAGPAGKAAFGEGTGKMPGLPSGPTEKAEVGEGTGRMPVLPSGPTEKAEFGEGTGRMPVLPAGPTVLPAGPPVLPAGSTTLPADPTALPADSPVLPGGPTGIGERGADSRLADSADESRSGRGEGEGDGAEVTEPGPAVSAGTRLGRVAGHSAIAGTIALGLSAVQLIPTAEFIGRSFRPSLSLEDLARDPLAWNWLDNLFLGCPLATEYLDKSTYFGISMLPLILLALVAARRPWREWFFAALALVGVWIALGTQAGAFQLFTHLPVLRSLSGPSRALVLFAVGTSALVGFGADRLLRRGDWRKERSFRIVIVGCALLALGLQVPRWYAAVVDASVASEASAWPVERPSPILTLVRDYRDVLLHTASPRGEPSVFLSINGGVFLALGVLVVLAWPRRRLPRWSFALALGMLLVVDLLHFRPRLPLPTSARKDLSMPVTAAVILRDTSGPYRVVGYEPTRQNPGDMNNVNLREFLMPNLAALYGLRDIQGFDPLILRDYVRLVEATAGRSPIDDPVRMLNIARPDPTLFRLLNVRYLIGDVRERLIEVFRPPKRVDRHTLALNEPTTLTGISLVTLLDQAEVFDQDTPVARIVVHGEGSSRTAFLRTGVHTADWRAADERFPCRHRPAREHVVWEVSTPRGPVRVADYYARVVFDRPIQARSVEILKLAPKAALVLIAVGAIGPEPPGWEKVFEHGRHQVWKNRRALGGAWLVRLLRPAADEDEALRLLASGQVDLAREAVITGGVMLPETGRAANATPDRVEFVRYEADRMEVRVDSARPGLLCFAEVFYPGWKAEVDGEPVPIERVNFLLRGVVIPTPGTHTVTMHFAPRSLAVGKAVSALAFLAALGLLVATRRTIAPGFGRRKA